MPCLRAGMAFLRFGKMDASHEKSKQKPATNANCISVSVAGFENELRIDFDEVFVRAEDIYHTKHSTWSC